MTDLAGPVAYLENIDFDSSGKPTGELAKQAGNKPIVVMAQASWCHHCTNAKPAFQEFAESHAGKVFPATIHSDGAKHSEKQLAERIKIIDPSFRGFPHYMLFKNKQLVNKQISGRSIEHLSQFALN